jgi:hypothetical protein
MFPECSLNVPWMFPECALQAPRTSIPLEGSTPLSTAAGDDGQEKVAVRVVVEPDANIKTTAATGGCSPTCT